MLRDGDPRRCRHADALNSCSEAEMERAGDASRWRR